MGPSGGAGQITVTVDRSMAEAEAAARRALADAGFGILTEIDVAATLRAKLGVERPALRILGACNPSFADRALQLEPSIALLLPCNVVLRDLGGGRTEVAVVDPRALVAATGDPSPALVQLGDEAAASLEAAAASLAG